MSLFSAFYPAPVAGLILVLTFLSGCSMMPPVISPEKQAEVLTPFLRAKGAGDALLGAIGWKVSGKEGAYFEARYMPEIAFEAEASFELKSSSEVNFGVQEAGLSVEGVGKLAGTINSKSTERYRIVTMRVRSPLSLAKSINRAIKDGDSTLGDALSGEGLRIVTSVTKVYDSATSRSVDASIAADVPLAAKIGTVNLKAGGNSSITVNIADGTTVFYRLSRLCWKSKDELSDLMVDQSGPDSCRNGASEMRPK